MFERFTGFFRRFRSKRSTSETTAIDSSEADFGDFGLDDADFGGDLIGTGELGAATAADEDLAASLPGDEAFETFEASDLGARTSLSEGSGEQMLEDSLGGAETFETLGEDAFGAGGSTGAGGVGLEEGFGELGGFGEEEEGLGLEEEPLAAPTEPAKLSIRMVALMGVVGLAVGVALKLFVFSSAPAIPLEQQVQKKESDLRKAQRELSQYNQLGGRAAIEQLQTDLTAARQQYATIEDLQTALSEAQTREEAYDVVVTDKEDAQATTAELNGERAALTKDIRTAERRLTDQRDAIGAALARYQRLRRSMEASAVVADAFDNALQDYVDARAQEIQTRPVSAAPVQE